MVHSTEEPKTVEVQSTEKTGNGVVVNLLVHWNPQQITVDDMDEESHQEWEYEEEKLSIVYQGLQSELNAWLTKNENRLVLLAKQKVDDLTTAEKKKLIDYETGKAISSKVHPSAGIDEQIGILRYAITELYNRLGETAPAELQNLNKIANEEIQNGQTKKSNL